MAMTLVYQRRKQRIGLTALIDVVFILLMFFMLTSTFISSQQIEMKTPVVNNNTVKASMPVIARLDISGNITVNGEIINALEKDALSTLDWYIEKTPVVLIPKADVSVQAIVTALEQLSALEINQLTLGNASDE
jgi:biopolymer transport protein ExbD